MTQSLDRPLRALIVEDEHLLAASLADALQRLGLEVRGIASSSAEAVLLLERGDLDIAFIDLVLGGEYGGLELAKLASARSLAVVLVTGHLTDAISDTLASLPSTALLTKPYSTDQLRTVVAMVRRAMAKPG